MSVTFLTRLVPHYREPLFAGLHDRCGLLVAAQDEAQAAATLLQTVGDRPWLRRFPFRVLGGSPEIVDVPVGRILRETGAELVVAEFSSYLSSTWKLALRRRLRGRPRLVFWTHGFAAHRAGGRPVDAVLDRMRLWALRSADAVACYTGESRDYLARFLPPERLHVIDNTIDIRPIREQRARQGGPRRGAGPSLLAVGRMTPDKRLPLLVETFRRLLARQPRARLTIIGDGPDADRVRALAGELLGRSVVLPGLIYDEAALAPYFLTADLFVATGAVGLGVNHALAYGLPVVAFAALPPGQGHHPEIAYVIDDVTGWRVAPFGAEAMSDALARILAATPSPRERLGASIDRFVDERLTMDGMVQRFARVIREVSAAP